MPSNKVGVNIRLKAVPKASTTYATPIIKPVASYKSGLPTWLKVVGLITVTYVALALILTTIGSMLRPSAATSVPSVPAIANYAAGSQTVGSTETSTQTAMDINNQYVNTPIACYLSPCLVHKMGSFDSGEIQDGQTVLGTTFQMSKNESEEDVWNFSVDTPANATFSFSTFVTLPNQNPNTWRTPDYSDAFGFQVLDKNNNVVYKSSPHEFQISVPLQTGLYRLTIEVDKSRIRNYAGESNAVNAYYWLNILGL